MVKKNRDDFLETTKRALAQRANYRCSFPSCGKPTSGPSDESLSAYVNIGVAAHIYAAAPGGPRYDAEMLSQARSDIANAIWLCQTHSRLIDEDHVAFPAEKIQQMKADHEGRIRSEIHGTATNSPILDFVAVGPNLVFTGELIGSEGAAWNFRIDHFLIGDLTTLIQFSENFNRTPLYDRFVLINAIGDGRELAEAPAWKKINTGYVLSVQVLESFPRISASELPTDWAINERNDIFAVNGDIATVAGIDALPQKIRLCLSTLKGEMPFNPTFGTRIKEYFDLFKDSPWLPRLIKLEAIRMASIPYRDTLNSEPYTPLRCVLRVRNIEQLPDRLGDWTPFRFNLDLEGVGAWQTDLPVFIPYGERPTSSQ